MGSLIHPKLTLDCRFPPEPCLQKPIGRFLADVSKIHTVSDRILKLDDFVNRLQDEMKKIDAFKRELPLCMLLLSDAIVAAQEELAQYQKLNSEPVLEQLLPLEKICSDEKNEKVEDSTEKVISSRDKKHWTSSLQLQLWHDDDENSNSNTAAYSSNKLSSNTDTNKKKRMGEEINQPTMDDLFENQKRRAFEPFKGCPSFAVMAVGKGDVDELPVPGLSLCTPGTKNSRETISPVVSSYSKSGSTPATSNFQASFKTGQLQSGRKQRRCWSPELHRQFIDALQHLGGPQAATPKQIREHMQVHGLTNDEVKSHLQKYRLHMRRIAINSTYQPVGLWASQEPFGESLKQSSGQFGSPEGPLHLSRCTEGEGETLEDEDDE